MPQQVVIIGAGLAGLTAACVLTDAGVNVTVLEARSVPGGRLRTVRAPFDDGLLVDLGGEHVPDIHYRLRHYVSRFGVATTALHSSPFQSILFFQGKRVLIAPDAPIAWPPGIAGVQNGQSADGLESTFTDGSLGEAGDPGYLGWPRPEALQFDAMTMKDFLLSRGASEDQVSLLELGLNALDGEGYDVNSALFELCSNTFFRGFQSSAFIKEGAESLPKAMAQHLGNYVTYDAPVRRIEERGTCFEVIYGPEHSRLSCRHLIVTVPFSALRHVDIDVPLPASKRRAIDELPNTSVTRTFLQFRERFWEDIGLSGAADTDLQIMSVFPGEPSSTNTKRGILESYTAGINARKMAMLPEPKRIQVTLEYLETLFPGAHKSYERGISFAWDDDPWARGAYGYYAAGQVARLYRDVPDPVGRMHFAGDHTTPQPGWMEGAIQSGERAASEVLDALGGVLNKSTSGDRT